MVFFLRLRWIYSSSDDMTGCVKLDLVESIELSRERSPTIKSAYTSLCAFFGSRATQIAVAENMHTSTHKKGTFTGPGSYTSNL
jgi:hypothetical protein